LTVDQDHKNFTGQIFKDLKQRFIETLQVVYDPEELPNVAKIYFEDRFNITGDHFHRAVTYPELEKFSLDLKKLSLGEPVQYVVGKAYFFENFFEVTPAVLIPRPETEELVALAIERLSKQLGQRTLNVLDIGTGSGCIAISVGKKAKNINMFALDISREALDVASANAKTLQADVKFMELNFLDESGWIDLPTVDFVLSNPPYIAKKEAENMAHRVIDFEPGQALFVPDDDPLVFYRKIFDFSTRKLNTGAEILAEISEFQSENLIQLCQEYDGFECVIRQDLQGKPRILHAVKRY